MFFTKKKENKIDFTNKNDALIYSEFAKLSNYMEGLEEFNSRKENFKLEVNVSNNFLQIGQNIFNLSLIKKIYFTKGAVNQKKIVDYFAFYDGENISDKKRREIEFIAEKLSFSEYFLSHLYFDAGSYYRLNRLEDIPPADDIIIIDDYQIKVPNGLGEGIYQQIINAI